MHLLSGISSTARFFFVDRFRFHETRHVYVVDTRRSKNSSDGLARSDDFARSRTFCWTCSSHTADLFEYQEVRTRTRARYGEALRVQARALQVSTLSQSFREDVAWSWTYTNSWETMNEGRSNCRSLGWNFMKRAEKICLLTLSSQVLWQMYLQTENEESILIILSYFCVSFVARW